MTFFLNKETICGEHTLMKDESKTTLGYIYKMK